MAIGSASSMPRREAPVESSAPARMRLSSARLLTTPPSTRRQKSQIERNGPPSARAAQIAATAFSPTPLTALSPNRISPSAGSVTSKSDPLAFTSGGSTARAISAQAAT
jgi:hypothetical protein